VVSIGEVPLKFEGVTWRYFLVSRKKAKFKSLPRRVNPTCRSGRFRSDPHRIPTFFIKNRSDPTEFLSDSLQSHSDPDFVGIRRKPMKSGSDLVRFQSCSVEFRQNPGRNPTEGNPTKTLSDPIEIFSIRWDSIPPQSHGYSLIRFIRYF
jgi:hypothetical protein